MNYLVSYNHSGNTWVRYCIEYLTRRPTYGHRKYSISRRYLNFLGINEDCDPVLIKRHTLESITDEDYFILLLRDPHDCIKDGQDVYKEFLKYYSLIQGYEAHKGPKTVIYYNKIFDKKWAVKIIEHFKIQHNNQILGGWMHDDRVTDLLENWPKHQGVSLRVYNNETDQLGADLSVVPKILLEHDLIKNTGCTVHF